MKTVQLHQDALMASAWEQLDEIEAVNQALRQAQLTREVGNAVQRAYARSDMLAKRRSMLEAWAMFCAGTADASHAAA